MIKRTIEISKEPAHLAVKLDQLLIQRHEADPRTAASIPCEDIGLLMVDEPQTTYSHQALARLVEFGAAVVICGKNHLPVGVLLPLADHTEVVWRIQDQMAAPKPLHKRLWQQIVVAKVWAQGANLANDSVGQRKLFALSREVKSGDPANIEAQAAKVYWSQWLNQECVTGVTPVNTSFRRDPDSEDGFNAMLNYGYAVLRAAVARALVAAGLHPALGIHHCNRSNAFCLADDLLEPLRPIVDAKVRELYRWGMHAIDQRSKPHLLQLLTAPVRVEDQSGPLMVALHRYVASLVRCFQGDEKRLLIPIVASNGSC